GLFIVDIAFVATGRTTLVVIAVLLVIFGFQQFGWKGLIGSSLIGMALAGLLWVSSPYLRDRVTQAVGEFEIYRIYARGENSTGQRFEFWKISIELVAEAPLVG